MQSNIILEILGRPKEHVIEALNILVSKIGTEQGVKIIDKTLHDPIPVQDSKDLFTTFAEILVELDSLENYFGIMFAYMPSNMEIIKPEKISLSNQDLSQLGYKIIHRLHDYDAITKKALIENEILIKKLQSPISNNLPTVKINPSKTSKKPKKKKSR